MCVHAHWPTQTLHTCTHNFEHVLIQGYACAHCSYVQFSGLFLCLLRLPILPQTLTLSPWSPQLLLEASKTRALCRRHQLCVLRADRHRGGLAPRSCPCLQHGRMVNSLLGRTSMCSKLIRTGMKVPVLCSVPHTESSQLRCLML